MFLLILAMIESQGGGCYCVVTVTLGLVYASRHCSSILQKSSYTELVAQISQETLLLKFVIAGLHSNGLGTLYSWSFTTYIYSS